MPATVDPVGSSFRPASQTGELPPLLKSFLLWTVGLFCFSVLFHVVSYFVFHKGGHQVWPLSLTAHDRFYDFTIFTEKFSYFHTARFWITGFPINYPAPAILAFEFFFRYCQPHALLIFETFCILSFVASAALFGKALTQRGITPVRAALFVLPLLLFSWPVLLIVDGGNAEVVVFLMMLTATWAYSTGRLWIAAIFFGFAASLKLFPFVFLALFLRKGQISKLLAGAVAFFIVSIISLYLVGPTTSAAYHGVAFGLNSFKVNYMAMWHTGENGVDHSMFAFYKGLSTIIWHGQIIDFSRSLRVYTLLTAVGGILLYFLRIRKMPLLNQLLLLTIASIYFTAFSGDGTLIHLYYPLAMLFFLAIQAYRNGVTVPGLQTVLGCMMVCLSMESFLVIQRHSQGARFIGPAHAIALGIMLIAALRNPFGPPLEENLGEVVLSHPVTGWVHEV